MKRDKLLITMLVCSLLLALIVLKDYSLNSNEKSLSIEDIKVQLKNTNEIYVCKDSESITKICNKKSMVKAVKDASAIETIIKIIDELDENTGDINASKDRYRLYFTNNGKVIIAVDFGTHFTFITKNNRYHLLSDKNEEIAKILELID